MNLTLIHIVLKIILLKSLKKLLLCKRSMLYEAAETDVKNGIRYISETQDINNTSIHSILTFSIYLKKMSTNWAPRIFTTRRKLKGVMAQLIA